MKAKNVLRTAAGIGLGAGAAAFGLGILPPGEKGETGESYPCTPTQYSGELTPGSDINLPIPYPKGQAGQVLNGFNLRASNGDLVIRNAGLVNVHETNPDGTPDDGYSDLRVELTDIPQDQGVPAFIFPLPEGAAVVSMETVAPPDNLYATLGVEERKQFHGVRYEVDVACGDDLEDLQINGVPIQGLSPYSDLVEQ